MNVGSNLLHQYHHMATSIYLEKFMYQLEVIETCGGILGYNEGLVMHKLNSMTLSAKFTTATTEQINNKQRV